MKIKRSNKILYIILKSRNKNILSMIIDYLMNKKAYKRMVEKYEDILIFEGAEAYKEGIEEGISIDKERGKLEIAHNLLSEGVALELIIKATGLKEQQIMNYQKST